VSQLRQREDELNQLGVAVVVVTFQSGFLERAYVDETGLQWPLLVDETRELYRAYGMERGRAWNLFGPRSIWKYLRLMVRGRLPKAPSGDPWQLGGNVLVDPQGMIRLHHVGSGPADRPKVEKILKIVRG
jgi:alkyl hydroperoxide reductase subunit AhpC